MPEIILPTKAQVDEILDSLGKVNDAANLNGSAHAKLRHIANTVNTVNTNVNSVNTNVSNVNTNIGSNANPASASGSVHAKLKDIKAGLNSNGLYVYMGNDFLSLSGSPFQYVTLLNIIGGGKISLRHRDYSQIKVTVDGKVLSESTADSGREYYFNKYGDRIYIDGKFEYNDIEFGKSLLIEGQRTASNGYGYVNYHYWLER